MKKNICRIVLSMILVTAMMLLTACPSSKSSNHSDSDNGKDDAEKTLAVAVVMGWRTGNNKISINAETITDEIYESCYSNGYVFCARVDGDPEQYIKVNIPEPEVKGLSDAKLKAIANGYKDEIMAEFQNMGAAKYPEADTLEAIRMEASALRETSQDTDKHMVIVDSGLSTAGYLNFLEGDLFKADTKDIIAELNSKEAIPDLSDIRITWLYCGETAAPQHKLSEAQKNKLKEIYASIFEAGNAADYTFREDVPTSDPYTGLPEVSTISAEERKIDVPVMETIVLDSSKVSFVGDEATFIEPNEAKRAISAVADKLKDNLETKVYIVGSTAGMDGDSKWCKQLSEKRASAVANVLKEFGIQEERLTVLGLGSNAPWHVPDVDSSGNWIEDNAQLNRCVYIVDENDPNYGEFLSRY